MQNIVNPEELYMQVDDEYQTSQQSDNNLVTDYQSKILKYFGGMSNDDLFQILSDHLKHDLYRDNSLKLVKRFINQQSEGENIAKAFSKFAEDKIRINFESRMKKCLATFFLYGIGSYIYLKENKEINPLSISIYLITGLLLGIGESREKRNVATINHCQENLGQALFRSIKELYQNNSTSLKEEKIGEIEEILNYKNPHKNISQMVRYLSYVSGPVVSVIEKSYSKANNLTPQSTPNIYFAIILPFMPLINSFLSYYASQLRQKSIKKNFDSFEMVVEKLYSKTNYPEDTTIDFQEMTNILKTKIQKPHCSENFLSGDHKFNPRKAVSFFNWCGNQVRDLIPTAPGISKVEDLTKDFNQNESNRELLSRTPSNTISRTLSSQNASRNGNSAHRIDFSTRGSPMTV